jgi:hypothetical protein
VIKRIKWPIDWNRPLSREEREIAKRLDTAPDVSATNGDASGVVAPRMAMAAQSWHSSVSGAGEDEAALQREEA